MIKKQQKWIALLVVCTFAWLMHVSAMPLSASGSSEKTSSVSAETEMDHYEAVGQKSAPAKKKSILPWVLIGVGVLAAVTVVVLFLFVLNKYDIIGSWVFVFTGPYAAINQTDFTGTKKSGNWIWAHSPSTKGTFTVDGKNLTMVPGAGDGWSATITGTFTSKDAMSGTWIQEGVTWSWTATRGTAPTRIDAPAIQSLGAVD